jgi:hypothetical protein
MQLRFVLALALFALAASAQQVEFKHPDRIRYDADCLTIDGKDTLIFSGAFHYFRCPKPLWRDRLAKIREAGFNTVETYVAWNWHERNEPKDLNDFSQIDLTDLVDFMKLAHEEFGLYTIIRPGPYICAEWAGGGFPAWLMSKRPANTDRAPWVRSDDPVYLAWSKHWMDAVCKVVAPQQITRKPAGSKGVILFQIENEYDFFGGVPEVQRVNHLKSLYRNSIDGGIDVPIFTCWTRQVRNSRDEDLKNVFDGFNAYPRWGVESVGRDMDKIKRDQPNAPGMVPELQGGWFAQVGGMLSEKQDGVTAAQINAVTLMALQHQGTILNYYMLFGGTNFAYWPARTITTTYDYASPIRETGGVTDKYLAVKALGTMLQKIGPQLTRSVSLKVEPGSSDGVQFAAREAKDGTRFIFCFNPSRDVEKQGAIELKIGDDTAATRVEYQLGKFGYKVAVLAKDQRDASQATWYPQPISPIDRPAVPSGITLSEGLTRGVDFSQAKWQPVKLGSTLSQHGIPDARYVVFKTKQSLTRAQIDSHPTLQLHLLNGDPLLVRVNGKILPPAQDPREKLALEVKSLLSEGDNEIVVLYENAGYSNFGATIENVPGLVDGYLSPGVSQAQLVHWRVQLTEEKDAINLTGADVDDTKWLSFDLTDKTVADMEKLHQPGAEITGDAAARTLFDKLATAVFRTTLEVTPEMLQAPLAIEFGRIDDTGIVFVNGQEVGRTRDYRRVGKFDITRFVKPGRNSVAVIVTNRDRAGGLTRVVTLLEGKRNTIDLAWEMTDSLDCGGEWSKAAIPTSSSESSSLMQWYQFEFDLPKAAADVWVPWVARIHAKGNGLIYLNGEHVGRYWGSGPQHDFYLPECWLKNDGKNILQIALRPRSEGQGIQSLEIAPVAEHAERRNVR